MEPLELKMIWGTSLHDRCLSHEEWGHCFSRKPCQRCNCGALLGFGCSGCSDFLAKQVKRAFGETQHRLTIVSEVVDFSRSLRFHVPFAFYVTFLLELSHQGVDGAWSEVDAEGFSDFRDYLVTVHGL